MPNKRKARHFKPSHNRVLLILLKCVPLCLQAELTGRFEELKRVKSKHNQCIRATPIQWIRSALKELNYCLSQNGFTDDVYPKPGMQDDTYQFFLLDVIHNCKTHVKGEQDPDEVRMTALCNDSDMEDNMDYRYCTVLGFLPGAAVFYDCCNRRPIEWGVAKLMVQLDMSWLQISATEGLPQQLSFGAQGYVKGFGSVDVLPDGSNLVSGWRVSRNLSVKMLSREVYWALQCSDADGPRMPPDFVLGEDISHWPAADCAQEYNRHFVSSNSVRAGGQHYALRSWHKTITKEPLVIEGSFNPNIDIVVDIAPIGK
jgi:hypothetical protein